MTEKTSLTLTNFPPCGFVKLNNEVVSGLEGEVSETVTVVIPNIPNGNHSLEVDSGLGIGIRKYNDIVICKDGSEKTIDLSRFFCTLCIQDYDVNYKLYIDNMPAKYYVSNDSIVTGIAVGKHNLLFKSKDNEFEKDVEIKQGFNKIHFERKKVENKEIGDELIEENDKLSKEELSRMIMELGKVSAVKVSKNGVRIIKNEPEKIERPKRDVFIPPPLPRIKAKRVESIDGNISIPAPVVEEVREVKKNNTDNVTKQSIGNLNEKVENSGEVRADNIVDINSVRQERVENNGVGVVEEDSIVSKIGLGGALAAGLYFLFRK